MLSRLLFSFLGAAIIAQTAWGVPIVDGADSVTRDDDEPYSMIMVRERYFDTIDISDFGMLQSCGPVDQFSPNPPPPGSTNATRVQSLLVRSGHVPNDLNGPRGHAGTITFSPGVTILGVVCDIDGTDGWIWGYAPGGPPDRSQTRRMNDVFGIPGYGYTDYAFRGQEVSGDVKKHQDMFEVTGNTLTFHSASGFDCCDDLHVLISYNAPDYGDDEYFNVSLTEGSGLHVGADYLGDGASFNHIPLTPEPGTLALLGLGAFALVRRRR